MWNEAMEWPSTLQSTLQFATVCPSLFTKRKPVDQYCIPQLTEEFKCTDTYMKDALDLAVLLVQNQKSCGEWPQVISIGGASNSCVPEFGSISNIFCL